MTKARKKLSGEEEEGDEVPPQSPIATPLDILFINTKAKKWFHKGREITKPEQENLKSEADVIARTVLWRMLIAEGKYHAQKRAIIDTNTGDETKDMSTLRKAQAYHEVITFFETFILNIKRK